MATSGGEVEETAAGSLAARSTGAGPWGAWVRATHHSLDGVTHALKTERAFRHEAIALIVAVPLACVITPDLFQRAVLIGALLFVMVVELLNTCVEKICDLVMPHRHPMVKSIKDMGSAAVFCSLSICLLAWCAAAMAPVR